MSFLSKKQEIMRLYDNCVLIFKNNKKNIVLSDTLFIANNKNCLKVSIIFYKEISAIIIESSANIELTITIYDIFKLEIPDNVIILNVNYYINCPLAPKTDSEIRRNIKMGFGCILNIY